MASWSLDEKIHVLMVSTTDRNVTKDLISTLVTEYVAKVSPRGEAITAHLQQTGKNSIKRTEARAVLETVGASKAG